MKFVVRMRVTAESASMQLGIDHLGYEPAPTSMPPLPFSSCTRIREVSTGLETRHPPDRRFDNARAFYTWNERQRLRVQTTPMIDVNVVDADRGVPYAQFAGPWRPDLDGLSREDVPPAGCVNSNDAVIFSGRMDKAVLHLRQLHSFHYLLA
jgi:hypothetical protein